MVDSILFQVSPFIPLVAILGPCPLHVESSTFLSAVVLYIRYIRFPPCVPHYCEVVPGRPRIVKRNFLVFRPPEKSIPASVALQDLISSC
jgi:hypothetical protein